MRYAPRFTAKCPNCNCEADQGAFRCHALREFLDEGTLRFYCAHCDAEWEPSEQELTRLEEMLDPAYASAQLV